MAAAKTRSQTGDAGEYLVAAEFSLRGWSVSVAPRGQKGIDLFAYNGEQRRTCGVQVKTRVASSRDFRFDAGLMEHADGDDEWVVLVTLESAQPPLECLEVFVVPRHQVTAAMLTYARSRDDGGAGWTARYLGPVEFANYRGAWELLDRPAKEAQWMMPPWVDEALGGQ